MAVSHLDARHDSNIKVETKVKATDAEHLYIQNCDHAVLVTLADMILQNDNVEYVAVNEVHPLQSTVEMLIRIKATGERKDEKQECVTIDAIFQEALSSLNKLALDDRNWSVQGTTTNGGALQDVCELPDGRVNSACLVLHDVDYRWANAVRRAILSCIPVLAITEVNFRRNTSIVCDELLAHRLSMIPVRYKDGEIPSPNQDTVSFSLAAYIPDPIIAEVEACQRAADGHIRCDNNRIHGV